MTCPFCESDEVEVVSPWAGQIITCQVRCRACNTYFEAIREEFEGAGEEFEGAGEEFEGAGEATRAWTTSSADDR